MTSPETGPRQACLPSTAAFARCRACSTSNRRESPKAPARPSDVARRITMTSFILEEWDDADSFRRSSRSALRAARRHPTTPPSAVRLQLGCDHAGRRASDRSRPHARQRPRLRDLGEQDCRESHCAWLKTSQTEPANRGRPVAATAGDSRRSQSRRRQDDGPAQAANRGRAGRCSDAPSTTEAKREPVVVARRPLHGEGRERWRSSFVSSRRSPAGSSRTMTSRRRYSSSPNATRTSPAHASCSMRRSRPARGASRAPPATSHFGPLEADLDGVAGWPPDDEHRARRSARRRWPASSPPT